MPPVGIAIHQVGGLTFAIAFCTYLLLVQACSQNNKQILKISLLSQLVYSQI
jgi:hypothetical protein